MTYPKLVRLPMTDFKRHKKVGHYQCQSTPGLYKHVLRPVTFTLVIDGFGVKFIGDQHANHLKRTPRKVL